MSKIILGIMMVLHAGVIIANIVVGNYNMAAAIAAGIMTGYVYALLYDS